MTDDAIGDLLAVEEHRQGMRYGEDPGHCDGCAAEAKRLERERREAERQRLIAECEHDGETVDLTKFDQPDRTVMCVRCGTTWEEPR